jgi:phosphoglycerate dehydrogenase-like enzyme
MLSKDSKIAVTSRSFSNNSELVKLLRSRFKNVKLNSNGLTLKGASLIKFLNGIEGAIIGIEPISSEVISKLPSLKLISKYGVGTNNLDLDAIKKNNVTLSLSPGSNSQSVAEYALYLILLSLRKNFNNLEEISRNIWSQKKGRDLYGKKIGIIGYGNIGKKLTSILKPFNVEIMVFDKVKLKLNKTKQSYISQVPLNKLLKESDIISIHLPLLESTNDFLAKKEFAMMKRDVVLVNTARGGIVKEGDLYQFLKNNPEAFAAFDVFKKEPVFNSKLFKLPNFFASSHRASLTNEGIFNMGMAAIDGLLKK